MSLSKDLKYLPLVIRVTGNPRDFKIPAISTPIYPPPTTKVLPGAFFKKNISSLLIPK